MARLIFLVAAGLALCNGGLVLGGAAMLDSSTLLLSAFVAGLFAAIAGLLIIVEHHLTRLRRLLGDGRIEPDTSASLGRLTLWLSLAALGTGLVMAIALTGIAQRLGAGTAVFG
ncbi:hypothetical protein VW29_08025 [Devosia limi DSM 17137]|uniref:Uncharacterized protein n=1 Tax=Devosia limi DSM 17137 TaxID=1121477 RepID=A0A0F5LSG7_9HYPH|nr:hypothetical protein [Devosia limi]KKB85094.1 hypothetical protein VW29_08025 [Devosia limi DSM 17137]SHF39973.1 hypothetical protein SAMN02745223_02529 [Devosia limi DSM 17137]